MMTKRISDELTKLNLCVDPGLSTLTFTFTSETKLVVSRVEEKRPPKQIIVNERRFLSTPLEKESHVNQRTINPGTNSGVLCVCLGIPKW